MRLVGVFDPTTFPNPGTTAPTTGQGKAIDSGLTGGCGTLYFLNKSNIGLILQFENGQTVTLPAWHARRFTLKQKSNQIWVNQAYTLAIPNPPIQQVWLEAYQPGEDVSGLFSGPIPYQQVVGGNVSTILSSIQNFGETATPAQAVVIDQPATAPSPTIDLQNNGLFALKPLHQAGGQGGQATFEVFWQAGIPVVGMDQRTIVTDGAGNLSLLHLLATLLSSSGDLSVAGSSSLDNGAIVTDGAGNMTLPQVIATTQLKQLCTLGGLTTVAIKLQTTDSKTWQIEYDGATGGLLLRDTTDGYTAAFFLNTGQQFDNGKIATDGAGTVSLVEVKEAHGSQESGHVFWQFVAPSTVAWVFWVPFRLKMTNVPSGITLSGATPTNCTAAVAGITATGFRLTLTPTAAGTVSYDADWTTVGN